MTYHLNMVRKRFFCLLFLSAVLLPQNGFAGNDSQGEHFLNVKKWQGKLDVTIETSFHRYEKAAEDWEEEKIDSKRVYRINLLTGNGMQSMIDPFVADDKPDPAGSIEKGDMFEKIDFGKMEEAIKRSGGVISKQNIDIGSIMAELDKIKSLNISANKYKQWADVRMALNSTGTWEKTHSRRGEYRAPHRMCSYKNIRSTNGQWKGAGGMTMSVNLQKQVYSFSWGAQEKGPQMATETYTANDSCSKNINKTRQVSYESFLPERWTMVKFEPLPSSGSVLSGKKIIEEEDDEGIKRKITLQWLFSPEDCDPEVDIFYAGENIKDREIEVVVGEKVTLSGQYSCGGSAMKDVEWAVDGKFVENYEASQQRGVVDLLEGNELKQAEVSFYWWDKGENQVELEAFIKGEKRSAKTKFIVRKPEELTLTVEAFPGGPVLTEECEHVKYGEGGTRRIEYYFENIEGEPYDEDRDKGSTRYCSGAEYWLLTYKAFKPAAGGKQEGTYTVKFERSEVSPEFNGEINFVQLITQSTGSRRRGAPAADTIRCFEISEEDTIIDATYPYNDQPNAMFVTDDPFVKIRVDEDHFMHLSHTFEMYLMYKPEKPDAIFVPVKVVGWDWMVEATRVTNTDKEGTAADFVISSDRQVYGVADPVDFPKWESVNISDGSVWGKPFKCVNISR